MKLFEGPLKGTLHVYGNKIKGPLKGVRPYKLSQGHAVHRHRCAMARALWAEIFLESRMQRRGCGATSELVFALLGELWRAALALFASLCDEGVEPTVDQLPAAQRPVHCCALTT